MRDTTERPGGYCRTLWNWSEQKKNIYRNFKLLLEDQDEYEKMSQASNPYGDGTACQQIVEIISEGISIMEKVSIVMPSGTVEEYHSIASQVLWQQTCLKYWNHPSRWWTTDRSGEICDQYAQEDDCSLGAPSSKWRDWSNARNTGVKAATTDWLSSLIQMIIMTLEQSNIWLLKRTACADPAFPQTVIEVRNHEGKDFQRSKQTVRWN